MDDTLDAEDIIRRQRTFFSRNHAGCAFAAYAARNPERYGWRAQILNPDSLEIGTAIGEAISDPETEAISLLFPAVDTVGRLCDLLRECDDSGAFLDESIANASGTLVRLRAKVGSELSWVTGFAPLDFLPKTRQSPFCELTIRVKPRPQYEWHFKPPQQGVVHLADLSMKGLSDRNLRKLWGASFVTTRKILGHDPDEESAAKTTFFVPQADYRR